MFPRKAIIIITNLTSYESPKRNFFGGKSVVQTNNFYRNRKTTAFFAHKQLIIIYEINRKKLKSNDTRNHYANKIKCNLTEN